MTGSARKATARGATDSRPGKVRIIGGRWRGRRIDIPALPQLRPSPDRVRETLFNWLEPVIAGARCLDLFAGSGALGIEALSRGAAGVVFVDREPRVARHIADTLREFGGEAEVHVADAIRFLAQPAGQFDIVFLDPPFAARMLPQALHRLADGWMSSGAHVYVEGPADVSLPALPTGWSLHRSRRAGQVGYHLLRTSDPNL